ncbi:MAG: tetratricopeptide repeat protein [Acidobacteria bacterium]|nr:tetratricopeptide repeat protein [Acidobacteriota bacterium]
MSPALTKEHIQAIAVLGFNAYEQGRSEEARSLFHGLTTLDDNAYYGYAGLGAMALRDGDLRSAIEQLEKAAQRNPEDATVQANLGEALLRSARFEEAAKHFRRALELDPNGRDSGATRARAILEGMEVVVRDLSAGQK